MKEYETEAVVRRCSVRKVPACNFIKKETLAQASSYEFCEISKNTFCHWIPLVAASDETKRSECICADLNVSNKSTQTQNHIYNTEQSKQTSPGNKFLT